MMKKGYRLQDVFPNDAEFIFIGGENNRKGTMGALIANLNVIEDQESSEKRVVSWHGGV